MRVDYRWVLALWSILSWLISHVVADWEQVLGAHFWIYREVNGLDRADEHALFAILCCAEPDDSSVVQGIVVDWVIELLLKVLLPKVRIYVFEVAHLSVMKGKPCKVTLVVEEYAVEDRASKREIIVITNSSWYHRTVDLGFFFKIDENFLIKAQMEHRRCQDL